MILSIVDVLKGVYAGDAEWRANPENLAARFVKGASGNMASIASFASFRWTTGPQMLQRFNGLPAVQFQGMPQRAPAPVMRWT